jgi:hypothetical protein
VNEVTVQRGEGAQRCAFCHEALGAREAVVCAGCGSAMHVDCGADLARCPTLGCVSTTFGPPPSLDRSPRRVRWVTFGLVFPAVAFAFDATLHKNPLAWGSFSMFPEPGTTYTLFGRAGLVLAAVLISMGGMLCAALGRADRATRALLLVGVAVATAHALVFIPLLPISIIGIMVVIGLLGLTPYVTLWAFVDATRWVERGSAKIGSRRVHLAFVAGLCLAALHWSFPPRTYYPAPAASRLAGIDAAALRAAAAQLSAGGARYDIPSSEQPEPLRTLAQGARVSAGDEHVRVSWELLHSPAEPGYPYGYSLYIVTGTQDRPPDSGTCVRSVEFEPGLWSQYVVKGEPPGDGHVFVRFEERQD